MIARARELAPIVRQRADRAERERRIPDETFREFRDAGFFRVLQPAVFGGLELPYGTHTDLAVEIARGCPSSAWVLSVIASHGWIFGMFPYEIQAEFWGADPHATLATSFFADGATVVREPGGFRLNGRWKYSSGIDHCAAALLMAVVPPAGAGARPEAFFLYLPRRAYRVEDTWYASGLIATGSNDIVVDDVFVPDACSLSVQQTATGATPGARAHDGSLYALPLFAIFGYTLIGAALGAARGALDVLADDLGERASVTRVKLREQQSVQLRIAEATAELDAADALLADDCALIAERGAARELPNTATRVGYRLHLAYAAKLCVSAVDRLYPLAGAQGLAAGHPLMRAWRDVHAVSNHIGLVWDVQATNFGAVRLGLDPPDPRL